MSDRRLAQAVAYVVGSLPADQVEQCAALLENARAPRLSTVGELQRLVPTEPFRAAMSRLVDAWRSAPPVDGAGLALALRSAVGARIAARADSEVEVVWTGPQGELNVRLTYAVVLEVISAAKQRLTLVSFAAHGVHEVADALRRAASSGVVVRLILDAGTNAAQAFSGCEGIAIYTWPPTRLPDHHPGHASLHAKAAVADASVAFVTSANLTDYALERNLELGLVVRGGEVPRLLSRHFDGLIASRELVRE